MIINKVLLMVAMLFIIAITNANVSQDVNNLMNKINQVNQDLSQKQKQHQQIQNAIGDSNNAIDQSKQLLIKLRQKRDLDINQLHEIEDLLPKVQTATQMAQNNVKMTINKIYQRLKLIQNDTGSILTGNDSLQNSRKKVYLIKLLEVEMKRNQELQHKLNQLTVVNNKINVELQSLNNQLGITSDKQKQLEENKNIQEQKVKQLQTQIKMEQQQLSDLKEKQAILNQFIADMATKQKSLRNSNNLQAEHVAKNKANLAPIDAEDSSPFLQRELKNPIDAPVLVNFGSLRGGVRNNGILFRADSNLSIYSISDGKVVYAGTLTGFGQMVVIDNGDNYISIYSGVLPRVHQGQLVKQGSIIATSGNKINQPLGGFYFELRHLGKPVNPDKLIN